MIQGHGQGILAGIIAAVVYGVGGSSANSSLQSVVTEASATPATPALIIGPGQNAVRVFYDEINISEPYFTLYVSLNGGGAQKVEINRWTGRILTGFTAGDAVAFGTSDGRTLQMAMMAVPAVLVSDTAATGTANCDQALPPLWAPSAAHITLPAAASAFRLESDGTERLVFISELDPTSATWTKARMVRLAAARDTWVQCTYAQIALANEAGATLGISAPAGTTIGGTKAVMSLPMPTITGTTYTCTTGAEFATNAALAVAGDAIVVSGEISLTGEVTASSFTANQAAGRKGYEGILIRGVTAGDRASGVINGNGFGWTVNMPGAGEQMTLYGYLKDLTFDWGANAKLGSHGGGKYRHENVLVTGGTGDCWDYNATNYPITVDALFCRVEVAGDDCWNLSGNATYNAASLLRFVACDGDTPGNNAASQCFTSHVGLAFAIYGGTWSNAHTNVIANDASTTPGYVYFATLSAGARQSGVVNGIVLYGVTWTDGHTQTTVEAHLSRITTTLSGSTVSLFRNSLALRHNIISASVGRLCFNSVGAGQIIGNILTANEGVRLGSAAGAVASTNVLANTFTGGNIGFSSQDVSNMPSVLKNNAGLNNTTSINVVAGGGAAVTGNYNTMDPTVSANYTPGANDITNANAALDANLIPTAAGNCDGNGDATLFDYVGGSDPFGFVFLYKSTRASRGARDIPAIYAAAAIFPDFY